MDRNKIIIGDSYVILQAMETASVDCVVTSPPYYALRDYGLPKTKWPACELRIMYGFAPIEIPAMECCLGLESDPLQFVAHLVLIFEQIKRVLKPWGTCWVNMGDTYATRAGAQVEQSIRGNDNFINQGQNAGRSRKPPQGLKVKDMMGVPWMMAFALRSAGWWLRSDIIWYKENAMPESVRDRPTKAHEYFFLLTKRKKYFYDADAIREPHLPQSIERAARARSATHKNVNGAPGQSPHTMLRPKSNENLNRPRPNATDHNREKRTPLEALDAGEALHVAGSNKRTVWNIPTKAFKGAHFATFPDALITPCILAGTSQHGNCAKCGKPYTRIAKYNIIPTSKAAKTFVVDERDHGADENDQGSNRQRDGHKSGHITEVLTKGWAKPCKCDTDQIVRPLVLDPFIGSGTTAAVAKLLSCDFIGIDLAGHYEKLRTKRLHNSLGLFA